jgi:MULE transposase domain
MKFPSDDRENKWAQIYTIHVHENGVFVPAVTIASSKRTARVYTNALMAIKEYIHENNLGGAWEPEVVLTDFEPAVGNALQLVFQHDYLHKGCYFHYSQALMSHIKELGLMKEYNKNIAFNEYVRKLKVLAMVPFYSLDKCLEHLLDFR